MAREIILDTETTGLDHRDHRVIEIGCLEVEDYIPTGRTFYKLINPERPIDPDAERVHGIGAAMLADKPRFAEICEDLLAFIGDAVVVAHNAAFDRGFINAELARLGRTATPEEQWVCTFQLAQKRFPGMYNSLDALCRRFRISLSEREKHGALIDARLLASVYLELKGGRERALDFDTVTVAGGAVIVERALYAPRPRPLAPRSTPEERAAHAAFVAATLKDAAIWSRVQA
ncbi:MAG: DNA polymerase III subunit epsilon [Pseudomonadota bacterium]|nr:DNA polymerase III subunit epsilon [Pseudomonadota bacterium]